MICQRPAHKARGLLWEFVVGKVEPGGIGSYDFCPADAEILRRTGNESICPRTHFLSAVRCLPMTRIFGQVHAKLRNVVPSLDGEVSVYYQRVLDQLGEHMPDYSAYQETINIIVGRAVREKWSAKELKNEFVRSFDIKGW